MPSNIAAYRAAYEPADNKRSQSPKAWFVPFPIYYRKSLFRHISAYLFITMFGLMIKNPYTAKGIAHVATFAYSFRATSCRLHRIYVVAIKPFSLFIDAVRVGNKNA